MIFQDDLLTKDVCGILYKDIEPREREIKGRDAAQMNIYKKEIYKKAKL